VIDKDTASDGLQLTVVVGKSLFVCVTEVVSITVVELVREGVKETVSVASAVTESVAVIPKLNDRVSDTDDVALL
jgi:hypothetical protein